MVKFENTRTGRIVDVPDRQKDRPEDHLIKATGKVDTAKWRAAVHANSTLDRMTEADKWERTTEPKTKPAAATS